MQLVLFNSFGNEIRYEYTTDSSTPNDPDINSQAYTTPLLLTDGLKIKTSILKDGVISYVGMKEFVFKTVITANGSLTIGEEVTI